jgi:CubicO group peptidase (beta-lactamase class C family)
MAGILRDPALCNNDLIQSLSQKDLAVAGLPPLNTSILPPRARRKDLACPAKEHISSVKDRAPVFLSWESPAYSDAGFTLLGLAIENITSRSLGSLLHYDIFEPLQMISTRYTVPAQFLHAVVPGGATNVSFGIDFGSSSASGGIYSTTNDQSKLRIAILNSTLLPPEKTHEWLKPVTHTADLHFSLGRPWEILRHPQGADGRIVDLYTKAGDLSQYSAYLVLSPDHEYEFSVLMAKASGRVPFANSFIADTLASTMILALEF